MTYTLSNTQLTLLIILVVWDLAWRGIALWKSSRRAEKTWFIALLIFNTAAVLPIIYLVTRELSSEHEDSRKSNRQHFVMPT